MLGLEGRLEREPQEFDVRVHLLIRDLEGARLLRRDDCLSNLTGDLLGRAHGGIRDLTEDDHALSVAFALDRRPGPRQEVGLPSPASRPRSLSIGILLTGLSSSGPRDTPSASGPKRLLRTA